MPTFTELVARVSNKLRRTSATDLARIGLSINDRYREVMTGVGLSVATRTTASANTVVGTRSITFTCEKVFRLYDPAYTPQRYLDEYTFDEIKGGPVVTDPPTRYAVQTMGASTVTLYLNSTPATIYALGVDCEVVQTDISGSTIPAFSTGFHDILYRGGLADELDVMEKPERAAVEEARFEKRLAELRYFIAKSGYVKMYAAKVNPTTRGTTV